jgi:hypothetical protein
MLMPHDLEANAVDHHQLDEEIGCRVVPEMLLVDRNW